MERCCNRTSQRLWFANLPGCWLRLPPAYPSRLVAIRGFPWPVALWIAMARQVAMRRDKAGTPSQVIARYYRQARSIKRMPIIDSPAA